MSRSLQWKRNGTDGSTSLLFFFAAACESPRTDVFVFVHSLSRAGLDGAQGVRAEFALLAAIGVRSVTGTGRQIGRTSLGCGLFLILGGSRADLLFSRGGRQPATSARQPPPLAVRCDAMLVCPFGRPALSRRHVVRAKRTRSAHLHRPHPTPGWVQPWIGGPSTREVGGGDSSDPGVASGRAGILPGRPPRWPVREGTQQF